MITERSYRHEQQQSHNDLTEAKAEVEEKENQTSNIKRGNKRKPDMKEVINELSELLIKSETKIKKRKKSCITKT